MKKILITGVSRGLGKVLSSFLAEHNCIVYGTVRNLSSFKDTDNIKYIQLDLEDNSSIDQAVEQIFRETDVLDAVIHNAGIAYLNPADEMKDHERRHSFNVNFFGPLYLTEKILPHFRSRREGKIIFISSIASIDPWPSLGVYSASKSALEKVAFEWAVLLKRWNIGVSVIRANPLPTDMGILKSENTGSGIYDDVFCNELKWEKIEDVCNLILNIINKKSPQFAYTSGNISRKTVNSLVKTEEYQKLAENYIVKLDQLRKEKTLETS